MEEVKTMACPLCGCDHFYVKNLEDEYEAFEFDVRNGEIVFTSEDAEGECPEIKDDTEAYCDNCAWHGKWKEIK
jgi:hypothetical protein